MPEGAFASHKDAMELETNDRLVRAARELLRWDQKTLAQAAQVGVATVRRFEVGAKIGPVKAAKIAAALRSAGVAFIDASTSDGLVEGVALDASARPLAFPQKRVYPKAKPTDKRLKRSRA